MDTREISEKPITLIVAADEPALFFSSLKVAETYLEAEDVRSGVYPEAYGPSGEPFDISVDRFNNVVISESVGCAYRPERLREIIYSFLDAVRILYSKDLPLPDLIQLCSSYVDDGS